MNIRNMDDYLEQIWDWTFLNDCFGDTVIRVTDIDGLVERHGFFLMIETKKPTVTEIPRGQAIMFDHWRKDWRRSVLVIYGYPGAPERACIWPEDAVCVSEAGIHQFVSDWYGWADSWGNPALRPTLRAATP